MSRYKAASIHLLLSLLIGAAVIAMMIFVWYPPPLFQVLGGMELTFLLVGVDVVIGPLITLIIYKSGKRGLKLDLTLIATVQAAALIYGLYVVALAKPAYFVFVKDRFELVSVVDLTQKNLDDAKIERFKSVSWFSPTFISAELPTDPRERTDLMFSTVMGGADVHLLPKYYRDIGNASTDIVRVAQDFDELKRLNFKMTEEVDALRKEFEQANITPGFLPLVTKRDDLTVVVDKKTGAPLRIVNFRPWLPF